jgi:hypothetical protein
MTMTELTYAVKSSLYGKLVNFTNATNKLTRINLFYGDQSYEYQMADNLTPEEKLIIIDKIIQPRIDAIKKQLGEV